MLTDDNGNVASTIGWEKAHNRRLGGGRSKADFVAIMNELNLAHPKKIDVAVPANLRCGLPDQAVDALDALSVDRGAWRDLPPHRARGWMDKVRVVDVREVPERTGPLGHVAGTENVPLADVVEIAKSAWDTEAPLVVLCRSGGRSSQAAAALAAAGFHHVYNLDGGMLAWTEAGLPVVGASQEA